MLLPFAIYYRCYYTCSVTEYLQYHWFRCYYACSVADYTIAKLCYRGIYYLMPVLALYQFVPVFS